MKRETIAAQATARGAAGVAIVRVSGPDARAIGARCLSGRPLERGRVRFARLLAADGALIDTCVALFFEAPHSYTGEDVLELQVHGGERNVERVLARVFSLGARPAEPGEFTKRAFLNGKLDLAEAESVMRLIGATSEAARRASVRALEGGVSRAIRAQADELRALLARIEAADDFPDEVEERAESRAVLSGIERARRALAEASDERTARVVRDGAAVCLIGRPNTGKSSLLNALCGGDRAIVTDVPGTTRDVLRESVLLSGLRFDFSDTAGLRETDDAVERIGVARARQCEAQADVVLVVMDASSKLTEADLCLLGDGDPRRIAVLNKADLGCVVPPQSLPVPAFSLSCRTGEGLDALRDALVQTAASPEREHLLIEERHIRCARQALSSLQTAAQTIEQGLPLDLAAVDLEDALRALLEITGESASEAVVTEIFSKFCVGK